MDNPPSIPEQIAVLESQIASLRDSNSEGGVVVDPLVAREIEAMQATIGLLKRWSE